MKLVTRNWPWLASFLAVGLICATYLLAQTGVDTQSAGSTSTLGISPPDAQETADAANLIDAVNSGDVQTATHILHNYGVANSTLSAMASRLGNEPPSATLQEPFIKASHGVWSLGDKVMVTNLLAYSQSAFTAFGYDRPIWVPRHPDIRPVSSYNAELLQAPLAPITILEIKTNDSCFIRWFLWCDRYVDYVHSIAINGGDLSNGKVDVANYDKANHVLNAMFRLIKARKPEAFVWLGVGKKDDLSDEQWLKAMSFRPDGLQIRNLKQFHSPFGLTRARYANIVGTNMPMMVVDFYGDSAEVQALGAALKSAIRTNDQTTAVAAMQRMGGVGQIVAQNLSSVETNLQSLGYQGISVQWPLLIALANTNNATEVDRSNLIDQRAGLLDIYFDANKCGMMVSLAADMISNSAPGDLNWTVAKLYGGMALLNMSPPETSAAINQLNDVISFNYTNRLGRDHYILGAIKWRIYAAYISGDTNTPSRLVRSVQNQNFRSDLKSDFLKAYGRFTNSLTDTSK